MNHTGNNKNSDGKALVSVICRSINRPQLLEAIGSVGKQTYQPIEIILVDCLANGIATENYRGCADTVRLITPKRAQSRSESANLGLESANGDFIMFLDDDDWISPDHIANLVAALTAQPDCRAAYSSVCKVTHDGRPTEEIFDHDFDPVLLRKDNYIPIHAVLFSRSLLADGCRFDESLDIYEDWDFWLQVASHTPMHHVAKVTAYYRQGGGSDTGIVDNVPRFTAGHPLADARELIYTKWKNRWSGRELNELIGRLDATPELRQLNDQAADLHRRLVEEHVRLVEKHEQLTSLQQQQHLLKNSLEYIKQSAAKKVEQLRSEIDPLRQELELTRREARITRWHLENHVKELETRLDEIYQSFSWRAMGPLRRTGRLVERVALNPLRRRIHFYRYGTEWNPQPVSSTRAATEQHSSGTGQAAMDEAATLSIKAQYREQAEQNLRNFLSSGFSITFTETSEPRVSILLVLFNQAPLTLLCLESIFQYAPYPYEVVIIDNASSDDTGEMLKGIHNAKVVRNDENKGFVKAVNQGAELCSGEYILLLNNDALLHSGSIESALRTIKEVPDTGAVGGKILLLDGSLQEAGSFIFSDGSCLGYGRHQNPLLPEYMFRRPVDYCSGAFLLFSTVLFREMGGFDEDYAPAYYEDSDFCVRLQKRGLKVIYDPDAVITHYEFASSGSQHKASELQTRHRAVLLAKHRDYLSERVAPAAENLLAARSANSNLKVLFIDDRVPHPDLGSGYPRSREMTQVLVSANLNLTFYPLQFPQESWAETYQTLAKDVEVILDAGTNGLAEFLTRRKNFYDCIIISRIHNMQAFASLIRSRPDIQGRTRIIYDAEAITAPREIRYRELQGEILSPAVRAEMLNNELAAARLADLVLCVSAAEAEIYRSNGYTNTLVLGHSLDPDPTPAPADQRRDLLFVGALRDENSPNVDSLHWFVTEVLPLLRTRIPELKLIAVGDNAAKSLSRIKDPAVIFVGRQPDVQKYYQTCRIFIAPTRFAAGIPHKVHEAAAHGVPCVVTSILARQLGWEHESELLVADDASAFAAACEQLYRDSAMWTRLRDSALEKIRQDCSARQFRSQLLAAVSLK